VERDRQTERRKDEEDEETAVEEVVIVENEQVNPKRHDI
jgi:hypothetical protein